MKKEIGGYYEMYEYSGEEFHKEAVAINSARNALAYINETKNINRIFLPCYICESIPLLCEREGIDYEYYHINNGFFPELSDVSLKKGDFLYIINYYGVLGDDYIRLLKSRFNNIIVDNVEDFFRYPVENVDTIYSCRKYFGVPDGGYLYTNKIIQRMLDDEKSSDSMKHILGRYENNASEYYDKFKENESSFSNTPLKYMSRISHNILRSVNYDYVYKKRNENYRVLQEELSEYNSITTQTSTFCYPFRIENAETLRKKLIEKGVYVPLLWPLFTDNKDIISPEEKSLVYETLPLPCDQRYGSEEMKYIAKTICRFI